ncbi:MAG: hypothetical protein U5N86_13850 [Planctomycetota bacterium]|nr:hypothetical protein [Planctomycetota bacterium]
MCNNAVKHLIRENKTFRIDSIIETGKSLGMVTLDESIYELYAQGKIGEQTALGKAQDREGMSKKIFGGGGSQRGSFSYR